MFNSSLHPKIRRLACCTDQSCLSIFLPLTEGDLGSQQNLTRLKSLLAIALDRLIQQGMAWADAHGLTDSVLEIATQRNTRAAESRGLAAFASPQRLEVLWLCQTVVELCLVGDHFEITPLLDFEADGSFVVLVLSSPFRKGFWPPGGQRGASASRQARRVRSCAPRSITTA